MIGIKEDRANKRTFISIDDATHRVRRGLSIALKNIGKENVRYCKELIKNPPKTGRVYTFGGSRHQSSAAGQAPANRTGVLLRSIKAVPSGWNQLILGDQAPHGKFLEDGTKNMDKRPHLLTTVEDKSRDNYNELAHQTGLEINAK